MGQFSDKPKREEDIVTPANKDWDRQVELLKLFARKIPAKVIGGQFNICEKTARRRRNKAISYPISLILTLPQEVQDYLIEKSKKQRPGLRDEIRRALSGTKATDEHFNNLSLAAKKLVDFLKYTRQTSMNFNWTLIEFATERNAKPEFMAILEDFHTKCLLAHMKAEKPPLPQLAELGLWDSLKRKDIKDALIYRLSLRAERKDFQGECDACKGRG